MTAHVARALTSEQLHLTVPEVTFRPAFQVIASSPGLLSTPNSLDQRRPPKQGWKSRHPWSRTCTPIVCDVPPEFSNVASCENVLYMNPTILGLITSRLDRVQSGACQSAECQCWTRLSEHGDSSGPPTPVTFGWRRIASSHCARDQPQGCRPHSVPRV